MRSSYVDVHVHLELSSFIKLYSYAYKYTHNDDIQASDQRPILYCFTVRILLLKSRTLIDLSESDLRY